MLLLVLVSHVSGSIGSATTFFLLSVYLVLSMFSVVWLGAVPLYVKSLNKGVEGRQANSLFSG